MLFSFFFFLANYKGASLGTYNLPAHQETLYRLIYCAKTQFTADN